MSSALSLYGSSKEWDMHSLSPTPQLLKLDHYASGVALNLDGAGWSFLFILRELA